MVTECLTEQQVEAFLRNKHNVLLYPHTDDFEGTQVSVADVQSHASNLPIQLIVLDGTWKKARKILYLNPVLASLPRLAMTAEWTSNYQIRKQKNAQSFSTIEAVGLALSQLEQDSVKYQPLFSLLEALNQQFERYRWAFSNISLAWLRVCSVMVIPPSIRAISSTRTFFSSALTWV